MHNWLRQDAIFSAVPVAVVGREQHSASDSCVHMWFRDSSTRNSQSTAPSLTLSLAGRWLGKHLGWWGTGSLPRSRRLGRAVRRNICHSVDWTGWQGRAKPLHPVTMRAFCAETMGTRWLWEGTGCSCVSGQSLDVAPHAQSSMVAQKRSLQQELCSQLGLHKSFVQFIQWHWTHWGLTPRHWNLPCPTWVSP